MHELKFLKLSVHSLLNGMKILNTPYKLTFSITYRCNARCKTCNIWKVHVKHELSLKEIEKFAESCRFRWINLTGGEPFLRRDLYEIIRSFAENEHTYLINFATNGSLKNLIHTTILKALKRLDIPRMIVGVSIDGPPKLHDELRGVPMWRSAINSYKKLREFAKEYENFETYVGMTLSPYNLGKIEETYLSIKREIPDFSYDEIHVNVFHVSPIYYRNVNQKVTKRFFQEVAKDVEFIKKKRKFRIFDPVDFLEKEFLERMSEYLKSGKCPLPCMALRSSVFIDPMGDVYPCTNYGVKLGNIREMSIEEILQTDRVKKLRKEIERLRCPQCWTACEAYQTIVGNIWRCLLKKLQ